MSEQLIGRWLSVKQASEYLACSELHLRQLIQNGELPASRIGKVSIRICIEALEAFMAQRPVIGPSACRPGRPRRKS